MWGSRVQFYSIVCDIVLGVLLELGVPFHRFVTKTLAVSLHNVIYWFCLPYPYCMCMKITIISKVKMPFLGH